MQQGPTNLAMGYVPQQPARQFGQTVLQAALLLQKLNACSINNLKKFLASGHQIDCHTLDAALKPFMKKAMDRNILKNLAHTAKISETKRRRKSSGGGKKRRKKSSGGKRRKSRKGAKSGGKRRRKRSKKSAAAAVE
ncbi:h15 domain-containing protein [Trichonephila clavata]|uniref:H15 domain-containing protein n=1 Tax=Trichonephila clavata TaxID=2740835 RepID=A0A8X6EY76_TRICU|nr:h15 domain-containing protein [Trichonephila clavata]